MNRLGMFVDISHVSHKVMHDVLNVTKAPGESSVKYAIRPVNVIHSWKTTNSFCHSLTWQ